MLLRMIGQSKGQFAAVLTIIAMGIAVFTALSMTAVNMEKTVDTYYLKSRFPDLFIETEPVPLQDVWRLADINGVKLAQGRICKDVQMVTTNQEERVTLRMITIPEEEEFMLSKLTLLSGRNLSNGQKGALLIEQFAKARNLLPGDEITIQSDGVESKVPVVGIVDNPEYIYLMENSASLMPDESNFGVCYISEGFGQQIFGMRGSCNQILIEYQTGIKEEKLIQTIEERLSSYELKQIVKQKDQMSNVIIRQELSQLSSMAKTIPILFLSIASIMLLMMIGRIVKKDRNKIGLLKALGYENNQILFHYGKYALIAGTIGGAMGSILGMALSGGLTKMYLSYFHIPLLQIEFDYKYILIAMLGSSIFCTCSGLIGARSVLAIMPSEAMRQEAPKAGKRIWIEGIPFLWKSFSFSSKLILKNISRSKKRSIFVAAGITVTYAMMGFTASMPDIMDQMMNEHFREFQKMDYDISFDTVVSKKAVNDLSHLVDCTVIEGKLEYPFQLSAGNRSKNVSIVGLERDTTFFSFKNQEGKSIALPKGGLLVSENLAEALKINVGDRILVKSYIPNQEDQYLTVRGIVKQALGINGYMDIDQMGRLFLEKNSINGVLLNSKDQDINDKLQKASNIASILSVEKTRGVYEKYMTMMLLSLGVMVVFSGILGFAIVYNATMVSLGEREMELSSLRVLGFTKREILWMIVKENNWLCLMGILLGIPVSRVMAFYSSSAFSTDLYRVELRLSFGALAAAAACTIFFVLLAQLATYHKIQKLDFLQALKNREG